MKINKIIAPIAITATVMNNSFQVKASCEGLCSEARSYGINQCTATYALPLATVGCVMQVALSSMALVWLSVLQVNKIKWLK